MKPNSVKNAKLIEQYPFLAEILDELKLEPFDVSDDTRVDRITIKVEKADGDLMWRTGNNIGLDGDNGFLFTMGGKNKNRVGKQGEHLFLVSNDNVLVRGLSWPRNDTEKRDKPFQPASSILWRDRDPNGMLSNPFEQEYSHYLVWVTIRCWYEDTRNNDFSGGRFGQFIVRDMTITIYTKPEDSFLRLDRKSWIGDHLFLDSTMLMRALSEKNETIINLYGRLDELGQLFQDDVYFNGMKEVLDKGKCRGASGAFGTTKVLVAELCGYDRVMLENGNCWVSFQLRPEASAMYVLGMGGTLPQLRVLVKTVIRLWQQPENRNLFKPDSNVSVI